MTGLCPEALAAIALRPGSHIAVRTAGPSDDPPQSRTSMFFPLPPQKEEVT